MAAITPDPAAIGVHIRYRAYQLDPTARMCEPTPVRDVYARKFGGPERAEEIFQQLTHTAAADGLTFDFSRAVRANTSSAHRLLAWAHSEFGFSTQSALKESLMAAYFTLGRDVSDPNTLGEIAAAVVPNVSPGDVIALLTSDVGRDDVVQDLARAASHGITGVPTYLIDDRWAIPGAQDSETFERVIRRALERKADTTGD